MWGCGTRFSWDLDRVEHQLTLGSGGPRSSEMQHMIDLMLAHDVYYVATLQMYGGINERLAHPIRNAVD